jgi:hypothetical protein
MVYYAVLVDEKGESEVVGHVLICMQCRCRGAGCMKPPYAWICLWKATLKFHWMALRGFDLWHGSVVGLCLTCIRWWRVSGQGVRRVSLPNGTAASFRSHLTPSILEFPRHVYVSWMTHCAYSVLQSCSGSTKPSYQRSRWRRSTDPV